MYRCCENADALLILTEWEDFLYPDFSELKRRMRKPIVIDGRNLYSPNDITSHGLIYESIGRPL
jgi:UDPglucose 6-dehydrogenase